MTTLKIMNKNGNVVYTCNVPFVYTKTGNETLYSVTELRISHLPAEIDIEPYDDVILTDSFLGTINLCVDTFTCMQDGLDNPTYTYIISLFSRTKHLECTLCPNLRITSGTNRTVYDYLYDYNNLYGEKRRYEGGAFGSRYQLSQRVYDKFSKIVCPELQWNQPNLREVLTDLMMIADCIPIIKDNEIDYLDLTESTELTEDEKSHINYITKSQSSEDYVSELQMVIENTVQGNDWKTGIDDIAISELVHFDSDDGIITTDNVFLKTTYPIYYIKKIELYIPKRVLDSTTIHNSIVLIDITNYIYEYEKFITLPIAKDRVTATLGQYQNSSLYYRRGDTKIDGFSYLSPLWKSLWSGPNQTTIYDILVTNNLYGALNDFRPDRAYAKIEYVPLNNVMFRAGKSTNAKNKRIVIDNQTNSLSNPLTQGMMEYMKANRLGNQQLQINARYENGQNLLDVFKSYNNNVIYQVTYQVYDEHLEINAIATKDYILRDYYTGVKSKLRSWKVVSDKESTIRNEFIKIYCEFDLVKHQDYEMNAYSGLADYIAEDLSNYGLFDGQNDKRIKYVVVYTDYSSTLLLELSKKLVGNSICYSFGFTDNYYSGKGIEGYDDNLKGCIFDYYKYTSTNGTCSQISFKLLDGIDNTNGGDFIPYSYDSPSDSPNAAIDKKMFDVLAKRPLVNTDTYYNFVVYSNDYYYYKDNAEITQMRLQYEFCNNSPSRIYFNTNFIKNLGMISSAISDQQQPNEFAIYKGPRNKWNAKNPTLENAAMIGYIPNPNAGAYIDAVNTDNSTIRIAFITDESSDNVFYITTFESTPKILFALDGRKTCYLNLLKDRDKDIYDSDGYVIDSI